LLMRKVSGRGGRRTDHQSYSVHPCRVKSDRLLETHAAEIGAAMRGFLEARLDG